MNCTCGVRKPQALFLVWLSVVLAAVQAHAQVVVQPADMPPDIQSFLGIKLPKRARLSDTTDYIVLDTVLFFGIRRTRPVAMLREMNVRPGDTIRRADLEAVMERNRQLLYNTGLFNKVEVQQAIADRNLVLSFLVSERWYVWPEIYFSVEERTLLEWLENPNSYRLTYGGGLQLRNLSGRNDNLRMRITQGFTESLSLGYGRPFIWPANMVGGGADFSYLQNNEVIVGSAEGPPRRLRSDSEPLQRNVTGSLNLNKRYTQNNGVDVTLGYTYWRIRPAVLDSNARFLSATNRLQDQYLRTAVRFWWDSRDIRAFPLKGHRMEARAEWYGPLGLGTTQFLRVSLRGFHYVPLRGTRLYWAYGGNVLWLAGRNVPYPEKNYLSDAGVRGFDTYVVDGSFFLTARQELRYELLKRQIVTVRGLPRQFRDFMVGIYPYLFADAGYALDRTYNRTDPRYLNRALLGYGAGIDIPNIYDNVLRVEVIRNNFGNTTFLVNLSVALR